MLERSLPDEKPYGESWEISDRPEAESVISNGPLAGRTLQWLMQNHEQALLGGAASCQGRFPLLIKIIDAREKLSLQVHPPAKVAAELGGEPKTEMWFVADVEPEAELYVGLRRGVTAADFRAKTEAGTVADCFHRISVKAGDAMFLPSGRVHAIGGGLLLFEIQQNSDTTYRVFDWNRLDSSGKPRELHVQKSLECIDFEDFEPELIKAEWEGDATMKWRELANNPLFKTIEARLATGKKYRLQNGTANLVGVLSGKLRVESQEQPVELSSGKFCLAPACLSETDLVAQREAHFLVAQPGS